MLRSASSLWHSSSDRTSRYPGPDSTMPHSDSGQAASMKGTAESPVRWWSFGRIPTHVVQASSGAMAYISRLSWADLNNLAVEAEDTQMHQMALATLERAPLVDVNGRLRIEQLRAHVAARLDRVPELRRILCRPGLLRGRPIWVDDPHFRIENHVLHATVNGGLAGAVAYAEREMSVLMDRSRPLWRISLLDCHDEDRLALVVKVHHALADGRAMINILGQVFDLEAQPFDGPRFNFVPTVPPTTAELLRDSLRLKVASLTKWSRRVAHPVAAIRSAAQVVSALAEELRSGRGAPITSLNVPIGRTRLLAAKRIPLEEVRSVAHRNGVTVNDVFLYLVATGLRRVLAARGELASGMSVRASVAVSSRRAQDSTSGNHAGGVIVQLGLDIESPTEFLAAVSAAAARAKTTQLPVVSTGLMVLLTRTGITRSYIRRQHMINVLTTNLAGPPVPLYFAGARIFDPVAIPPIAGNVTTSFAALSYANSLAISVVADGDSWPDLQVLDAGLHEDWTELVHATENLALSA